MWEKRYSDTYWENGVQLNRASSLHDVKELSDGSLIATGSMNRTESSASQRDLWVLKVNKNGCIDRVHCGFDQFFTTSNHNILSDEELFDLRIHPNPSSF